MFKARWSPLLGVIRRALVKPQNPTTGNPRPDRTPPSTLNHPVVCDGAVVSNLSNVWVKQACLEIRQGKHCVYLLPRYGQSVLSSVDTARPPKLDKVWRDNFHHSFSIKARLLTPKLLFELLKCETIVFAQIHAAL